MNLTSRQKEPLMGYGYYLTYRIHMARTWVDNMKVVTTSNFKFWRE